MPSTYLAARFALPVSSFYSFHTPLHSPLVFPILSVSYRVVSLQERRPGLTDRLKTIICRTSLVWFDHFSIAVYMPISHSRKADAFSLFKPFLSFYLTHLGHAFFCVSFFTQTKLCNRCPACTPGIIHPSYHRLHVSLSLLTQRRR